jgi:hypothetical protein
MGDCKGLVIVTAPVAVPAPAAQLQKRLAHVARAWLSRFTVVRSKRRRICSGLCLALLPR